MKSLPRCAALLGLLALLSLFLPSSADESAAQKSPLANIAYKSGDNLSEYET